MVFIMTVILLKIYSMTIKERFEKIKKNVLGVSYPLSVIQNFLIPIELDILNDERYHLYFTCQSFDQRSIC